MPARFVLKGAGPILPLPYNQPPAMSARERKYRIYRRAAVRPATGTPCRERQLLCRTLPLRLSPDLRALFFRIVSALLGHRFDILFGVVFRLALPVVFDGVLCRLSCRLFVYGRLSADVAHPSFFGGQTVTRPSSCRW